MKEEKFDPIAEFEKVENLFEKYREGYTGRYNDLDPALKPLEEKRFVTLQNILKELEEVHRINVQTNFCMLEKEKALISSFYENYYSSEEIKVVKM